MQLHDFRHVRRFPSYYNFYACGQCSVVRWVITINFSGVSPSSMQVHYNVFKIVQLELYQALVDTPELLFLRSFFTLVFREYFAQYLTVLYPSTPKVCQSVWFSFTFDTPTVQCSSRDSCVPPPQPLSESSLKLTCILLNYPLAFMWCSTSFLSLDTEFS